MIFALDFFIICKCSLVFIESFISLPFSRYWMLLKVFVVKLKNTLFLFLDSCTKGTALRRSRSSLWVGASLLLAADAVVMETTQREIWKSFCCSSPTCQQYSTDSVPTSVYPFELNQKRVFLINEYMWFSKYIFFYKSTRR